MHHIIKFALRIIHKRIYEYIRFDRVKKLHQPNSEKDMLVNRNGTLWQSKWGCVHTFGWLWKSIWYNFMLMMYSISFKEQKYRSMHRFENTHVLNVGIIRIYLRLTNYSISTLKTYSSVLDNFTKRLSKKYRNY